MTRLQMSIGTLIQLSRLDDRAKQEFRAWFVNKIAVACGLNQLEAQDMRVGKMERAYAKQRDHAGKLALMELDDLLEPSEQLTDAHIGSTKE